VNNILSLIIAVIGLVPAVVVLYRRLRSREPGRSPLIMTRELRAEVDKEVERLTEQFYAYINGASRGRPTHEERLLKLYDEAINKVLAAAHPALQHKDLKEFSDKSGQPANKGVGGVYIHLLNYLSHEMQQEMKDYLEDGIEERSKEGKPLKPFIISETVSLGLSIGKLKLFELRKSFRRKVS
jgi:hypothetical protein